MREREMMSRLLCFRSCVPGLVEEVVGNRPAFVSC